MAKDIKAKRTGEMSTNAAELYAFINRVSQRAVGHSMACQGASDALAPAADLRVVYVEGCMTAR
jgi:hypothetical protein